MSQPFNFEQVLKDLRSGKSESVTLNIAKIFLR